MRKRRGILFFVILLILIPISFSAKSIIREDCSGYIDCFTSLSSWEAQDNVLTEPELVEIQGTWTSSDTTTVIIDGWTTTTDNYISIYTIGDARHNGAWDNTAYRFEPASLTSLNIRDDFVRIDVRGVGVYVPRETGWV